MLSFMGDRVAITPPARPKKITGTRFASILGLDVWNSPFKTWCAITRTYEEPFVENQYTRAGKAIEPLVIDYLNRTYFFDGLVTPVDRWGPNYFEKTRGNFFDHPILGGMWDALYYNEDGKLASVVEIKTTKRVEDWEKGAPIHYALQGCLYAYLLGVDHVVMVASFLEDGDYDNPEMFEPSAENTMVDDFLISERYPNFEKQVQAALDWWDAHVKTGLSPAFDERVDRDILAELRTSAVSPDDELQTLLGEAEKLHFRIQEAKDAIKSEEKRFDVLKKEIRDRCIASFGENDKEVVAKGAKLTWVVTKGKRLDIDRDALEADGLLDKYATTEDTYRMVSKVI